MPTAIKWTPEQLQDIISSYDHGEPAKGIARRYNTSHQVIIPLLRKSGVTLRTPLQVAKKCRCDERYFQNIDTEDKAYWLGFLTADGCVTTRNRIMMHLALQDYEHLVKFQKTLQAEQIVSKTARSCTLIICSADMAADLAQHGVLPNKTLSTKPASISPDLERHYWRGAIDGDGCITGSTKQVILAFAGDYEMVLGFQTFALRYCQKIKVSILLSENIYTFHLTNGSARRVLEILYGNAEIYLERKYRRAYQIITPVDMG